jgi:uncharacterized protein YtpQ (UPF0354 family)
MRLKYLAGSFGTVFALSALGQDVPHDEGAFTDYVATLLRKEIGDASVTVKSPLTIGLGEIQANLDRVFAFCKTNSPACAGEIDRYVKGATEVYKERTALPTKDMIRVVIRTKQYVQSAQASLGGSGPPQIQPRPFVEGLFAVPVLDSPRTLRMLGDKDGTQLGLTPDEVYELGLANLRSTLKPLMEAAKVAGKGQIGRLAGDSFQPSRLLLLDTWAPLAAAQGGVLIVSIPASDAVFYVGEDTPIAVDALRALSKDVMSRAPNKLSTTLLRWRETGWEVMQP